MAYLFFYFPKNFTSLSKFIFVSSSVNIFFWSLIGWYPPLRFSLFSFGNVIILYLMYCLVTHHNLKIKSIILSSIIFGLININHWNNEVLIELNFLNQIGIFLLLLYLYEILKFRKTKI